MVTGTWLLEEAPAVGVAQGFSVHPRPSRQGLRRRRSAGTRWTNQQLLYHMVFGSMVVRALLPLVRAFGHLPDVASRMLARVHATERFDFHRRQLGCD